MVKLTLKNCTLKVWLVSLCLFISSGSLLAAELTNIDVQRKGKRFYMDSTLLIDAPVEAMYSVLTDYNSMHQFSRGIVHSQDVTPDSEGKPRVYTHIRGCVAFLCRSIERVERLDTIKNKQIIATLDPSVSKNVAWNISTWDLEALDLLPDNKNSKNSEIKTGTRIRYRMEFEPDFWVPPLIGGYLVKKSLSKDGLENHDPYGSTCTR